VGFFKKISKTKEKGEYEKWKWFKKIVSMFTVRFLEDICCNYGLIITATIPVNAVESGIDDSTALETSLNYLQSEASQWESRMQMMNFALIVFSGTR